MFSTAHQKPPKPSKLTKRRLITKSQMKQEAVSITKETLPELIKLHCGLGRVRRPHRHNNSVIKFPCCDTTTGRVGGRSTDVVTERGWRSSKKCPRWCDGLRGYVIGRKRGCAGRDNEKRDEY